MGRVNMTCNEKKVQWLNRRSRVSDAFSWSNTACGSFTEVPDVVGIPWDGPWIGPDAECGFVSGTNWKASCSRRPRCGYQRLCPCMTSKGKSTDMSDTEDQP